MILLIINRMWACMLFYFCGFSTVLTISDREGFARCMHSYLNCSSTFSIHTLNLNISHISKALIFFNIHRKSFTRRSFCMCITLMRVPGNHALILSSHNQTLGSSSQVFRQGQAALCHTTHKYYTFAPTHSSRFVRSVSIARTIV